MSKSKPMSIELKAKLLIQGEYLLIGIIFLVVGILKLTGVFPSTSIVRFRIFNFVTILGSAWIITDFLWSTFSKKRRAKIDYIDKLLVLPAGLFIFGFDIYSFVTWNDGIMDWASLALGCVFCYLALVYIFQAIYHWFRPTKALLAAIAQDEQTALERAAQKEEEEKHDDA